MTLFFIISACFLFFALSPYYRYTALIMSAVYFMYAVIEPFTYIESGLIYALFVLMDLFAAIMVLKWGDEGKLRIIVLFAAMMALNTASVFDYYVSPVLNQDVISLAISLLAVAQVGAMLDGMGDCIRVLGRGCSEFVVAVRDNVYSSRTDP